VGKHHREGYQDSAGAMKKTWQGDRGQGKSPKQLIGDTERNNLKSNPTAKQ